MHPQFENLTPQWFKRAFVYTGSIGDFRYRFATETNDSGERLIHASVYTMLCFEKARDVRTETFPWDEAGVTALKAWVDGKYREFAENGTL